jgi:hypothetical protein
MTQLAASAADLPLPDRSFDIVLASDILEHIPPDLRTKVIKEAARVADKLIIFGFPCGEAAHNLDRALRQKYLNKNQPVPGWLEEHMVASFPEPELFDHLPNWKVAHFANESLRFHQWMMRAEMNHLFVRVTRKLVRIAPKPIEIFLKCFDGSPSYRQIFVLTRTDSTSP